VPAPVFNARNWLQPIMRAAARADYPWTRLYDELRAVAPQYRKQQFGYDYRSYKQAYSRGDKLKYVSRQYKPSADLFTEARVGMRKSFKYNVQTEFVDGDGGIYSTRSSFVTSDVQLNRGEIEDLVRDRVSDIAIDYDCPRVRAKLTEAWHREGDAWD